MAKTSHFQPILESTRIYRVLGQYFLETVWCGLRRPLNRRENA
jgi:hypothetical protein